MKPLVAWLLLLVPSVCLSAERPNIIFILADDLGIGNVGCYGADNYQTPNLDKLASSGTRFTQCYTAALCGPSRAMILSGRYAFRTGATNQDACGKMASSELITPRLLKSAGYVTSAVGKWGQLPGKPDSAGFDDHLYFGGSGVYWNRKEDKPEHYVVNGSQKKLGDKEYMPDLLHQHVIQFIKQHRAEPFYIYYSLSHVHGQLQPTPDSAAKSTDLMADNIAYMDKLVGQLVAELDGLKLRDNTLILFMGDNGTAKGQAERATIKGRALSGLKGTMQEGGGLVPLIANWPGKLPGGKVCDDSIDSSDFVPTFAELAGAKLPEKTIFDGHSIAPQLRGEPGKPREWIYNQLAAMWYVREAGWKLNQAGELFDMRDAPFTEKLIAADSNDAAAIAARARLQAALTKLNPAGGILDEGDGTGRHAKKGQKKKTEK